MKANRILSLLLFCGSATWLAADSMKLKNGAVLQGTFMGANTREVQFLGPDGVPKVYAISAISEIAFAPAPAAPAPSQPSRPAPAPAAAAAPAVVVPAGTTITVRLIDNIDSQATGAGQRYRASIDDPVLVGSDTVIPRNADCTVQVVKTEGGSEVALKLYDVTINGKPVDVVSEYAEIKGGGPSKGKKAARRAIGLGAIGAAVGGIAGGGEGAAIGAAAGAGLGAVSGAAAKGPHLKVPSETRLNFKLRSPLAIR